VTEVNVVGVWFDPCRNDKGLKKFHSDPASVCDLVAGQTPSLQPRLGPLSHHEGSLSTLSNLAGLCRVGIFGAEEACAARRPAGSTGPAGSSCSA